MTAPTRAQVEAQITAALAEEGIHTALLMRLEFKSETIFLTTLAYEIQPNNTGDIKLDGNTFLPIAQGVVYDIGSNKTSEQGTDAFEVAVAVPADLPAELQVASIHDDEWLARPAIVWRAIQIEQAGVGTPAAWVFRRMRTGRLDKLEVTEDATQHVIKVTIEAWASYISDATNSTWADQRRFDPNDTSQNWPSSTANGQPIGMTYTSAGIQRADDGTWL